MTQWGRKNRQAIGIVPRGEGTVGSGGREGSEEPRKEAGSKRQETIQKGRGEEKIEYGKGNKISESYI